MFGSFYFAQPYFGQAQGIIQIVYNMTGEVVDDKPATLMTPSIKSNTTMTDVPKTPTSYTDGNKPQTSYNDMQKPATSYQE
jgi:hypothetical protein